MRRRILLLLLPLLAACNPPAAPRIAVVVSVGPVMGAKLAAEDIEQAGDQAAVLVETHAAPLQMDDVLALAESLARTDDIIAVVGHSSSAASLAAAHVYNDARIVQIAPTSTAPAYSGAGLYSFRLVPSDIEQARFIGQLVRSNWGSARRIAVIAVNDEYGRGLQRALEPQLHNVAFEAIYSEVSDTTQLHELGERVAAAQPELIIWLGRPFPLSIVWRRWRTAMPRTAVLCADACDAALAYGNPGGALTGIHFVRFIDPYADVPQMQEFQRRYRERTGEAAAVEGILTYDAVRLIGHALADGVRTSEDLRRYLASLGRDRPAYLGISGPISFTDAGDVIRPYLLAQVTESGVSAVAVGSTEE